MLVPEIQSNDKYSRDNFEYNTLYIEDDGEPMGTMYNVEIFTDEKEKVKFIKQIEKIVRQSYEYSAYIGMLKTVLNCTKCTFLPNIDINEIRIPIEFHHYPFTLYDLVAIEVQAEIDRDNTQINQFEIANKIIKLHFQNLVGLVPMSQTVHELCHDGKKFINVKYVEGDFHAYIQKYFHLIPDDYMEKIKNLEFLSKQEDEGVDVDGSILDVNIMEVINEGNEGDGELQYIELDETEMLMDKSKNDEYSEEDIEDSNKDIHEELSKEDNIKKEKLSNKRKKRKKK